MKITIWFIILTLAAIGIYDVWVIYEYGNEESISAHLLSMGEIIPQVPMLLGYTMGHLTIPRDVNEKQKKNMNLGSYTFFAVVGLACCHDVYQIYFGSGIDSVIFKGKEFNQAFIFLPSYLLGGFLWGMPKEKWKGRFKK